jgi:hypothetical protein
MRQPESAHKQNHFTNILLINRHYSPDLTAKAKAKVYLCGNRCL